MKTNKDNFGGRINFLIYKIKKDDSNRHIKSKGQRIS
jgi:hypothetical protein